MFGGDAAMLNYRSDDLNFENQTSSQMHDTEHDDD